MKKICFYELAFIRHDLNAPSESKLRRILAGDKVFYTYSKQFLDAKVLNQLVSGDRIYVGAHQLADGSYWLHWLVSPEKGELQPKLADISKPAALMKLVGAIMLMALSAVGYFQLLNIWVMLLLFFVFIFGCWWLVASLHTLMVGTSRHTLRLLKGLDSVKQGDTSLCLTTTEPGDGAPLRPASKELANDLDTLQPNDLLLADKVTLTSVSGEAANVSARRDFTGSGKSRRDFIDYQFSCNGVGFLFRSGINTLMADLNPLFYRQHPFFLAEGDPLMLVVNQQDNAVLGLCNERDGSAYLKLGGIAVSFHQLKLMYKVMFGCCSFLLLMLVFFTLHDWWEQGGMPDRWDWLDAAGMFYDFALMSIMIFCLFMLLVEVCTWITRRNSLSAARFVFVRQLLVLFKKRSGGMPYIQEVP
ncbi:hypothetical protein [Serratia fonticola]|uniref:hypothetical protein n=1 Tax=Serratia fonticola TaxID=47917 RepID=UPI0021ADB665|nr:hypothetical protein [Serratia fonticola]